MITRDMFSEQQEAACKQCLQFAIEKFDPEDLAARQMCIAGYAGTGKTSLLRVLVSELKKKRKKIICTATTNEAVRVISRLSGEKYHRTIYGLLGLMLVDEDDTGGKLIKSSTEKNDLGMYDIVFVDEGSMVKTEIWHAILDALRANERTKIVYIGDDAQLPPVKDDRDESIVFDLENFVQLTDVQRTVTGHPIISVATKIRNDIRSNRDRFKHETNLLENGDGIHFYDNSKKFMTDLIDDFVSESYKNNSNYVRCVAFTNKVVDRANSIIRGAIWGEEASKNQYVVGDKLLINSPVLDRDKFYPCPIYDVGERVIVTRCVKLTNRQFGFDYWDLRVYNYEEDEDDIVRYNLNVVDDEHIEKYRKILKEIAIECRATYESNPGMKKAEAWQPFFAVKNVYNEVKYNYAITVHKSQGSTFDRCYVVESDINRCSDDQFRNKLKYTAFTRPSKLLRVLP